MIRASSAEPITNRSDPRIRRRTSSGRSAYGRRPRLFWDAARALDPDVDDESHLPGTRTGHLAELLDAAGLREIEATAFPVRLEHPTFDAWWEPFTRGVGPAGAYLASLDADRRTKLR